MLENILKSNDLAKKIIKDIHIELLDNLIYIYVDVINNDNSFIIRLTNIVKMELGNEYGSIIWHKAKIFRTALGKIEKILMEN